MPQVDDTSQHADPFPPLGTWPQGVIMRETCILLTKPAAGRSPLALTRPYAVRKTHPKDSL